MMNATVVSKSVEGRVIVNYDADRVQDMLKIKDRFSIATERLVLEQIIDQGMKIDKVQHANKPNGIVDLILEFSGPRNGLISLYHHLKEIQNTNLGIGKIDIYLPEKDHTLPA